MKKNDLQVENIKESWDKTWDDLGGAEVKLGGLDYDVQVEKLHQELRPYKGKKVIEVGCGSGYFSLQMARERAEVTLFDISPQALKISGKLFKKNKITPKLVLGDALSSLVKSNTYDIVWNGGVIEHFYDKGKVKLLSEMKRIVKPGGIVLVSCPNKWDWPFSIAKIRSERAGTWAFGYEDLISPVKIRQLFISSGMKNPKVYSFDPIVGWWFLPHTRRLLKLLGLEKHFFHSLKIPFGHVTNTVWKKPAKNEIRKD